MASAKWVEMHLSEYEGSGFIFSYLIYSYITKKRIISLASLSCVCSLLKKCLLQCSLETSMCVTTDSNFVPLVGLPIKSEH